MAQATDPSVEIVVGGLVHRYLSRHKEVINRHGLDAVTKQIEAIAHDVTKDAIEEVTTEQAADHMAYETYDEGHDEVNAVKVTAEREAEARAALQAAQHA